MKATLEPINSISQAVRVEVTADEVAKSREKVFAQISKEMKVPGFRPGKIPDRIVEQRLGKDADKEIIQQAIRDSYPKAIRETNAHPISDPRVEPGTFAKGGNFSYRAIFEIYPEVKIDDYKGLKLTREPIEVSDEELAQELTLIQQRMTQLEPAADAALEEGFMALVDFIGTADGEKFEGGEAKNFVVDFGAGSLLKDFETQIQGMKTGEMRHINFRYPNDYFNKAIAGKQGAFAVTVKELRRKIVPPLDDDFAKSLGKFDSLKALQSDLKSRIEAAKGELQRRKLHRQLIEELAKTHPIDVPNAMVSAELSSMLEELNRQLQARGETLESANIDADTFVKENLDEARTRVRGFLLAHAVARDESISVSAEELAGRIKALAAQTGEPEAKVRAHIEKNRLLGRLETELLLEKALDFILSRAKIKDEKPKK